MSDISTRISTLDQSYDLADILIKEATKEQIAECARLLALNLAHHQIQHGEVPAEQNLVSLCTFEPTEAHLTLLSDGMVNLIGMLLSVCGGVKDVRH